MAADQEGRSDQKNQGNNADETPVEMGFTVIVFEDFLFFLMLPSSSDQAKAYR